jgi:hypothetical protein
MSQSEGRKYALQLVTLVLKGIIESRKDLFIKLLLLINNNSNKS